MDRTEPKEKPFYEYEPPKPNFIIPLVLLSLLIALIIGYLAVGRAYLVDEDEISSYSDQVAALDRTQASLDQLSRFIKQQREQMVASEKALGELKGQQKSLEPLVKAQRETVNALFREQEQRAQTAISRERWTGFALGVASSIFAMFLWSLGVYLLRRRSPRADQVAAKS